MKPRDIRFLNFHYLGGPNIWTYRPVLEVWVDIGALEESPSNTIPGLVDRLCTWLPTLSEHRCGYGEPGGFVRRLHEGTWSAHIVEHVALELQNLAGIPGGFGKAREAGPPGVYKVVVSAPHETATRAAMEAARKLVMAAIEDTAFDLETALEDLRGVARQCLLGPDAACIVAAATARDRGIPAIRLSDNNLVQLGYGARQRRIWSTQTDRTGAVADDIVRRPELTRRLLESCGLPVAEPDDGETDPSPGNHRLLVVGGRMVAAARVAAGVDCADVTDEVHPETAAAVCLAARVVGLDIAGVDVLTEDISRPLARQDGVITAVHAAPELSIHLHPVSDEPRPVGRAIVDHLFPNHDTGRIPVVGITGSGGTTEVAHLVAEFLRLSGKCTGLACGDGLFFDRRQVQHGDCANWKFATRVLMNRSVEAAVLENGADVILGQGLAYDRCEIGVVTRIDPASHFGRFHIETPEKVFQIFRTQVDVVLPDGVAVLNAADPLAVEMAELCDGGVVFFAVDPSLPIVAEHRSCGGRAVFVRGDEVILATAGEESPLVPLSDIPLIAGEVSNEPLENVLAAVAAAWALGIALHVIRTGIQTFTNAPDDSAPAGDPDPIFP
jgi:cyanophycin synthetase